MSALTLFVNLLAAGGALMIVIVLTITLVAMLAAWYEGR